MKRKEPIMNWCQTLENLHFASIKYLQCRIVDNCFLYLFVLQTKKAEDDLEDLDEV